MPTDETLHDYENHFYEVLDIMIHDKDENGDGEYARHLTEICYTHVLFN